MLDMPASMVYLVPIQDETCDASTRAARSHLGWSPQRRGAQARLWPPLGVPPSPRAARYSLSGARHTPSAEWTPLASRRQYLQRGSARLSRGLARFLPPPPVQRSVRSSPSGGGVGHAYEARARRAGARHPSGPCGQPRAAAAWARVGRPLPLTSSTHPARGPERVGLCPPELSKARARGTWARSALVGSLVSGVAHDARGAVGLRARGRGADLARADRWAAARATRGEGSAAESMTVRPSAAATRTGLP